MGQHFQLDISRFSVANAQNLRLCALPLPKVVRPREAVVTAAKRCVFNAVLRSGGRSVVQCNLEQCRLHYDHNHSLRQEGFRIELSEPIKDPNAKVSQSMRYADSRTLDLTLKLTRPA